MIPAMRDGWRWRGGLLLAVLGVVAAGTTPRAHDLERTTAHLTLAADGSFALRLAHDPAWLVLRLEGFAGAPGAATTTDTAVRDARLREWAPAMIDRVVLFVDGHEVRPTSVEYAPPPADVPPGQFALASYTLRGRMPEAARTLRWYYGLVVDPYPLTVTLADGSETTEWIQGDAWSTSLALGGPFARPSRWTRLWQYLALGYRHILPEGLDHILFVLGLFLLRRRAAPGARAGHHLHRRALADAGAVALRRGVAAADGSSSR